MSRRHKDLCGKRCLPGLGWERKAHWFLVSASVHPTPRCPAWSGDKMSVQDPSIGRRALIESRSDLPSTFVQMKPRGWVTTGLVFLAATLKVLSKYLGVAKTGSKISPEGAFSFSFFSQALYFSFFDSSSVILNRSSRWLNQLPRGKARQVRCIAL